MLKPNTILHLSTGVHACVCVCVSERVRERAHERLHVHTGI